MQARPDFGVLRNDIVGRAHEALSPLRDAGGNSELTGASHHSGFPAADQDPTGRQYRAINFRSLRRCVKAIPAIPSAPPIHVTRFGDRAHHREHDVVAPITCDVTDRENGTVAANHGTPLGDPRKCAGDEARGDLVQNGKCLPER